jgi:hypothetical protein
MAEEEGAMSTTQTLSEPQTTSSPNDYLEQSKVRSKRKLSTSANAVFGETRQQLAASQQEYR